MKRTFLASVLLLAANVLASAQFTGIDLDRLEMLLMQLSDFPQDNATLIVESTLKTLSTDPKSYRRAVAACDRLGDPADSLHNEVLYLTTLESVCRDYVLSASELARPKALLAIARKNAIGTAATDLTLTMPDGSTRQMLGGKLTLVYFNDPSCESCEQVKANIAANETLQAFVTDGSAEVVAVCTTDEKSWRNTTYPEWVVNTIDRGRAIENDEAYVLPTMPLFYLIAPDGTVLLKNEPSLKRAVTALSLAANSSSLPSAQLAKLIFNVK